MNLNFKYLLRAGLLAGLPLFFTSVVGMVEVFNERDVINEALTLGQVLIFAPSIVGAYMVAAKQKESGNTVAAVISGLIIGLISALPSVLLIGLGEGTNYAIRDMFISVTQTLTDILTFGRAGLVGDDVAGFIPAFFAGIGSSYLLILGLAAGGFIGGLLTFIPNLYRQALFRATYWTLGIGLMSELLNQMLTQFRNYGWISRDFIRVLLQSGSLKLNFAIIIFVLVFIVSAVWPYTVKPYQEKLERGPASTRRNVQLVGYALFFILLLALPWLVGRFLSDVLVTIGLYVLMGLGLNIAIGWAGLLDLGYLTNFAVGAYVTAVLISTGPIGIEAKAGISIFNFWLLVPISIISAMLTGFFFSLPVLKMRGDYLAIATLGFGEIIAKLAISDWFKPIIGGAQGILFIPKPNFFGIELANPEQLYYLALAACLFLLFVTTRLNNSRIGRQWMALREDEDVAAAMGIDPTRTKVIAFTLSAAAGGLAGALFASKLGTVFPNSFTVIVSINVLSLIIVGGMGSIPGIVVGAAVLIGLPELLREFSEFRFLLYGALLVIMMLTRPEGLWPSEVRRREILDETTNPVGT